MPIAQRRYAAIYNKIPQIIARGTWKNSDVPLSAVHHCRLEGMISVSPLVKPGFHMIVTVGDASLRQARGHIGDSSLKWKHFLNNVADVADQTGTVRGRIKRVEMSLKSGFDVIVTVIVSICHRLIGDMSPMCRSRSPTVTIIWKPGLSSP